MSAYCLYNQNRGRTPDAVSILRAELAYELALLTARLTK